jgi:hypothetical protein
MAAAISVSACDTARVDPPDIASDALKVAAESAVSRATVTPAAGKDGRMEYLLRVEIDRDRRRLRLPGGINVLGRRSGSSNAVIFDDGRGVDRVAGDGIYSGIIDDGCIPESGSSTGPAAGKDVEVTCSIDFVGPGETCGSWGECPERVHRSWLWGLIEYDVDILFCFCLDSCDIAKK